MIRERAESAKPKVEESLFRRMLWSMVSKVADKSKRTRKKSFILICGLSRRKPLTSSFTQYTTQYAVQSIQSNNQYSQTKLTRLPATDLTIAPYAADQSHRSLVTFKQPGKQLF